jgi:hypothetical protein
MIATTRADATARGLNKYDTGKPCRNGHRAFRYTQSGVCAECLKASQQRAQAEHAATAPQRADERRFALHACIVRERVPEAQVESLQTMAEALLACRFPALVGIIEPRCSPRPDKPAAGTVEAAFLVHNDDRAAFHGLCDNALRAAGLAGTYGLAARLPA